MISREEAHQKSEQVNKELEEARVSNIEENCKKSLANLSDMIESQVAAGKFEMAVGFIDFIEEKEDSFQNRRDLAWLINDKYGYKVNINLLDGMPIGLYLTW